MIRDTGLLKRVEALILKVQALYDKPHNGEQRAGYDYTKKALASLGDMILQNRPVFGIEPWHIIGDDVPLSRPGEMLLRVKDRKGNPIPPYPAIMTFYNNDMTADIDGVLFLCALDQFVESDEVQVSINISARSLRNAEFVKGVIERIESLNLAPERKIIIEIHESTPNLTMNKKVLDLFRKAGVLFAIDDVGLHMNDVLRLSEFEGIADFIKIDRHSVCADANSPNSLKNVVAFISSILPDTILVAEGVQNVEHAKDLHQAFPAIKYVQGLYLPERDVFETQWNILKVQGTAA